MVQLFKYSNYDSYQDSVADVVQAECPPSCAQPWWCRMVKDSWSVLPGAIILINNLQTPGIACHNWSYWLNHHNHNHIVNHQNFLKKDDHLPNLFPRAPKERDGWDGRKTKELVIFFLQKIVRVRSDMFSQWSLEWSQESSLISFFRVTLWCWNMAVKPEGVPGGRSYFWLWILQ